MRRPLVLPLLALALALLPFVAGCGTDFPLPTQNKQRAIPTDKSYQMLQTWTGMEGIRDILLTQGSGTQLFMVFNHGGSGTASRGEVHAYPLTQPTPIPTITFPTLFNPIAIASGGSKVYVLDQGDTCIARADPATGSCDGSGNYNGAVSDLTHYWRVRVYGLLGGDTLETFTDTTMAWVEGIAVDSRGTVYVSGSAIVGVPDPNGDPRFLTRQYLSRVYRYQRGPRYPGIAPDDWRMPGAAWHRDTTWSIGEGSGIGTVMNPKGLFWSAAGGEALYAADFNKNWIQKLSTTDSNTGFFEIDAAEAIGLAGPLDVKVDLSGYIYVVDAANARVLRYDATGTYVQRIDVEKDAQGLPLAVPVTVAVDDSLAYVGDAGLGKVIRYQRRK